MANSKVVGLSLLGGVGEQPDFVASPEILPFLVALRGDREWKQVPQTSGGHKVSPLVAEVWKTLEQKAPLSASAVRESLGRELTEAAVLRGLNELWQDLRAVPVLQPGEEPALWELLQLHHRQELTSGSSMSQVTALSLLVSMYLQSVYAASGEEIEVFLSPLASRSRIREAVRGLSATRQIHSLSMDAQTYYFLEGGLPEFAPIAEERETRVAQPDVGRRGRSGPMPASTPASMASGRRERSQRPVRKSRPPFVSPADRPLFPPAAQGSSAATPPPSDAPKRDNQSRPSAGSGPRPGGRPFGKRPGDGRERQTRRPASPRSDRDWKQRAGTPEPRPGSGPQERWRKFPQKPERQERRPFSSEIQKREARPQAGYADKKRGFRPPRESGGGKRSFGQSPNAERGERARGSNRGFDRGSNQGRGSPRDERTPRPEKMQEGGFRPPARRFSPRGDQPQTRSAQWRRPGEERGTGLRKPGPGRAGSGRSGPGKPEEAFQPSGFKPRSSRPFSGRSGKFNRPEGARREVRRPEGDRPRFVQGKPTNARSKFPPKFPSKFPSRQAGPGAGERERPASDAEPGRSGSKRFGRAPFPKGGTEERAGEKFGPRSSGKPRGFDSRPGFPKRPGSSASREGGKTGFRGKPGFRDRKFGKKKPEA